MKTYRNYRNCMRNMAMRCHNNSFAHLLHYMAVSAPMRGGAAIRKLCYPIFEIRTSLSELLYPIHHFLKRLTKVYLRSIMLLIR